MHADTCCIAAMSACMHICRAEGEAADLRGQGKELWDKTQVLQHQMTHYQTETRIIIENHQKELQKIK